MSAIAGLLSGPVNVLPCESVAQWWPRHRASGVSGGDSFSHAVAGGFAADRVGWAFASGYQAALRALFPDAPEDRICALCVTEVDGNSPKAIKSTLRKEGAAWVLNGAKRWTTLGPDGALFYVAARDEAASRERATIRLVRIPSGTRGLAIQSMPPTKFVPEVPHAQLQFFDLNIVESDLLPGDGYTGYVKPFRTVEDIHVNAAVLAYLVREARRLAWPREWTERCIARICIPCECSLRKAPRRRPRMWRSQARSPAPPNCSARRTETGVERRMTPRRGAGYVTAPCSASRRRHGSRAPNGHGKAFHRKFAYAMTSELPHSPGSNCLHL